MGKKRRIIVNCRFLSQEITGVQRFALEISREMLKLDGNIEFVAPALDSSINNDLAKELNVKFIGPFKGHLWEQISLHAYVVRKGALLISFCNTAPLFLKNQIITIHDIAFHTNPKWFSKPFAIAYNFLIPRIAKNSRLVLTVSEFSKSEIIRAYKLNKNKLVVINNGIPSSFETFDQNQFTTDVNKVNKKYILSVSSMNPRKNFKGLVKAFSLIEDPELHLYIIGKKGRNFSDEGLVTDNGLKRVHFIQNASDQELIIFYKNASLFVFPSFYEGFGIPIIEAAYFELPICASDIPVFREINVEGIIYFDPSNVDDIKNKMMIGLNGKRTKLDIGQYNWELGAQRILDVANKNIGNA